MKYLVYCALLIAGTLLAFLNYLIGYIVYHELTTVSSAPTPWFIVGMCVLTVVILDLTAILELISYRMLKSYEISKEKE